MIKRTASIRTSKAAVRLRERAYEFVRAPVTGSKDAAGLRAWWRLAEAATAFAETVPTQPPSPATDLATEVVLLKHKLMAAGLYESGHLMEEVERALGWALAKKAKP